MYTLEATGKELTAERGICTTMELFPRDTVQIWLCLFGPISQPRPLENDARFARNKHASTSRQHATPPTPFEYYLGASGGGAIQL